MAPLLSFPMLYFIPIDEAAAFAKDVAANARDEDGGSWMKNWTCKILSVSLSGFLIYSVYYRIEDKALDIDVGKYGRLGLELGGLLAFPYFLRHLSTALYPDQTLRPASTDTEASTGPKTLRAKHDAEVKKLEDQLKERDAKHQADMEERDAKHQADMEERDAKHQADMEERDAKHQADMEARDAKHYAEMEEQLKERDAKHHAEMKGRDDKHQAQMDKLEQLLKVRS